MKKLKASARPAVEAEDIPEVDFRNGVRGKHYKQYLASMVTVQLHPDVAQFFPDSESANEGLREYDESRRTQVLPSSSERGDDARVRS